MLTAKEYRSKSRKAFRLSTGDEVLIRKVTVSDCALSMGHVPEAFWDGNEEGIKEHAKKDPSFSILFRRSVVIAGVMEPRIVDKKVEACGDDELSILEIPDGVQDEILKEVLEFSMVKKEGDGIARFPEE